MNYEVSTEIGSIANYVGYEEAIKLVASAGFKYFDFTMMSLITRVTKTEIKKDKSNPLNKISYKKYLHKLKDIMDEKNIKCNQAHAPFPTYAKNIKKYILKSIKCAAFLGAKYIIIHPCNNYDYKNNGEILKKYLKFAKKYNIKICTENMWNWDDKLNHAVKAACSTVEDFKSTIDYVNDNDLKACLDIGHAEMMYDGTSAVKMIKELGHDRLKTLHIHDNDKLHDSHEILFSMNIDFKGIAEALKSINYDGFLTLECGSYIDNQFKIGNKNIKKLVKDLYNSVIKFRNLFD